MRHVLSYIPNSRVLRQSGSMPERSSDAKKHSPTPPDHVIWVGSHSTTLELRRKTIRTGKGTFKGWVLTEC